VSATPPSAEGRPSSSGTAATATVRLAVGGMHCASCTALVEESLGEHRGVTSVTVDLDSGEAVVSFDPAEVGIPELSSVVVEAGYSAAPID
jgi:P-type Cu+ transporter